MTFSGRWQRGLTLQIGAIKDKARVSSLCFDHVKAAYGNVWATSCVPLVPHLGRPLPNPPQFLSAIMLEGGLAHPLLLSNCLRILARADAQNLRWSLWPLMARWQFGENTSGHVLL